MQAAVPGSSRPPGVRRCSPGKCVTGRPVWVETRPKRPPTEPPFAAEALLERLVAIYLEKREALVRHFTGCLGSEAAAEDVVQDIYLKLCSLDLATPIHNETAFLYRLGSNVMLDRLRQRRRGAARDRQWRDASGAVLKGQDIADEPAADEVVAGRQRLAVMLAALEELPPAHREAFRLHKLEGLNQVETAVRLGVSLSSVEKYLRAALNHLVERLG